MENAFIPLGIVYGCVAILFILGLSPPFKYFLPIHTRDRIYASRSYLITMWVLYAILMSPFVVSFVTGEGSDFGGFAFLIFALLGIGLLGRTIWHR